MGAGGGTHIGGVSTFSSPLILFASHFLGVKKNLLNCESFFVSLRFLFESGSRRRGFLKNVFMSLLEMESETQFRELYVDSTVFLNIWKSE